MTPFDEAKFASLPPAYVEEFRLDSRFLSPVLVIARTKDQDLQVFLEGWRATRAGAKRYRMPTNGHDWVVDGGVIRRIPADATAIFLDVVGEAGDASIDLTKALELSNLASEISVHLDESALTMPSASDLPKENAISGLRAKLFDYQASGVAWMADRASRAGGFVLADEMGLGKTIQIISLLLQHGVSPEAPALIVAPTTLLTNWQQELCKFAPSLTHLLHRGSARAGLARDLQQVDIVITTYDTLTLDKALMESVPWCWVVLDEAQAVKNPETARRKALEGLDRQHLIPVTGTPVETSLRDLWSLLDLAVPGLLGGLSQFEERFHDDLQGAGALSAIVSGLILRRCVEDVASDLPTRIDVDVPIDADAAFHTEYASLRERVLEKYPSAGHLVAVNQLSLFCAHPSFAERGDLSVEEAVNELADDQLITPKVQATLDLLYEAFMNGRKVLLFSNFNGTVELFRRLSGMLPAAYWNAINGTTKQADRQKIVEEFSGFEGAGCLVLNPDAAGAGLNITAATIVIHFTLYWNPAREAQASARAHRRGQTQPVRIYRLYYPDTVEQVMLERSNRRREVGDVVLQDAQAEQADLRRAMQIGRADDASI